MSAAVLPNLEYHGRPLIDQPAKGATSVRQVASQILGGMAVSVVLEPGDATRYCFTIAPVTWPDEMMIDSLAVVRSSGEGGEFRSAALVPDLDEDDGDSFMDAMSQLANKDDWTFRVFVWWFSRLWQAIEQEEAAAR